MDRNKYASGELRLAERLRCEAEASRPAFSEELHQRICLVIDQGDAPSPRLDKLPRISGRMWTAIAATLLVAGTLLLAWRLEGPEVAKPANPLDDTPFVVVDGLSAVTQSTADSAIQMDSALTTEGWAYLDHDAHLAAELVLNQFPLDMLASSAEP